MLKPRHVSETPVDRGFRRLSHGAIHFRAGGDGPVVLALHESPRSSLSMLPVIDALSDTCRVIAPDTPGYGLSDPLSEPEPTLERFAEAMIEFLDALGLDRVTIYGAHTGAALALTLAKLRPDRVAALVLDGVSVFDAGEVEAFRTRYLAPYTPAWDGAHVMRLWSRVKDLYSWFPWYDQNPSARLVHEPPSLAALQSSALGFVQSGAYYSRAYIRAAAFDPNTVIPGLACPLTIMAKPDDLIASHLDRISPASGWVLRRIGSEPGAWRTALQDAALSGGGGDTQAPSGEPTSGSRFLRVGDGCLHAVLAGPFDGPVRLLIPDLPGDIFGLVADQLSLRPEARLIAFSPPGCGWSDPLASAGALPDIIDALIAGLARLGDPTPQSVAGEGAGAAIARLWVERAGWSVTPEAIAPPAWLTPGGRRALHPLLEALEPRWDGAHLVSAWFQLRDLELYDIPPGRGVPMRRAHPSSPDLARLERRFRSFVEGPECAVVLEQVLSSLR